MRRPSRPGEAWPANAATEFSVGGAIVAESALPIPQSQFGGSRADGDAEYDDCGEKLPHAPSIPEPDRDASSTSDRTMIPRRI